MSFLSRKMKKSAEGLHETYLDDDGNQMVVMEDAKGQTVHVPLAFLIAHRYVRNPEGLTDVGFKDGDRSNLHADNLFWYNPPEDENNENDASNNLSGDDAIPKNENNENDNPQI